MSMRLSERWQNCRLAIIFYRLVGGIKDFRYAKNRDFTLSKFNKKKQSWKTPLLNW